ncbi:hypothetical protein [Picosynechococcus sp. NKBG042902]|uniref:hypothetical protein n=1 Tax=Picosynechococcus sp. NKBG042902 TaxID=490193 RepID=UPI0005EF6466|nr:hypothetical protein [Picosynechococcus sp. NKBG042902]
MENERDTWIREIDAVLQEWCQGDYVLGEYWFVQRCDPKRPLTKESEEAATEEINLAEVPIPGFVVITQTCDIVRSCKERPFIEVSPLFEVDPQRLLEIQKARRPQYTYIPGVAELNLVADLDRVMTVEKAVVAEWKRQQGCRDDEEIRALGQALARKRVRFAFPDDFVGFVSELQKRIKNKHNKSSNEGDALRALREIRVRASPSWNSPNIELMFWFIRDENQVDFQGLGWNQLLETWLQLIPKHGRFQDVNGSVVTMEDITAKDYLESDPLDLDHLSSQN